MVIELSSNELSNPQNSTNSVSSATVEETLEQALRQHHWEISLNQEFDANYTVRCISSIYNGELTATSMLSRADSLLQCLSKAQVQTACEVSTHHQYTFDLNNERIVCSRCGFFGYAPMTSNDFRLQISEITHQHSSAVYILSIVATSILVSFINLKHVTAIQSLLIVLETIFVIGAFYSIDKVLKCFLKFFWIPRK